MTVKTRYLSTPEGSMVTSYGLGYGLNSPEVVGGLVSSGRERHSGHRASEGDPPCRKKKLRAKTYKLCTLFWCLGQTRRTTWWLRVASSRVQVQTISGNPTIKHLCANSSQGSNERTRQPSELKEPRGKTEEMCLIFCCIGQLRRAI